MQFLMGTPMIGVSYFRFHPKGVKLHFWFLGYYYQVEIGGETITWLVSHQFAQEHNEDVDYRVMRTFTEFYAATVSFVLYRLYTSLNLKYPPIAVESDDDQTIENKQADMEALTLQLRKRFDGRFFTVDGIPKKYHFNAEERRNCWENNFRKKGNSKKKICEETTILEKKNFFRKNGNSRRQNCFQKRAILEKNNFRKNGNSRNFLFSFEKTRILENSNS